MSDDSEGPLQALFYDYPADVLERRAPHREAHLGLAREWKADGRMLMGGPLGDPPRGALLVFRATREAVEEFAASDPYVVNGVATGWRIEPWNALV